MTMSSTARHVLAILVLPTTVTMVVPVWIARATPVAVARPEAPWEWATAALGIVVLPVGVVLFAACLKRFGGEGKGTLAPWDPPTRLVVSGPYAHVRHPMISGVCLILVAEGLMLRSIPHLEWAGAFFLINAIYIPFVEEPGLRARFGREYEEYATFVPRLIPRLEAWRRS